MHVEMNAVFVNETALTLDIISSGSPVNDVIGFVDGNVIYGVARVVGTVAHLDRRRTVRIRFGSSYETHRFAAPVLISGSSNNVFPAFER